MIVPRPYVFLDRDGTLVDDPGFVHRIEDYALLPGVVSGLRALQAAKFRLAIVSNQSGIGRGYFDHADYERFQAHLLEDLSRQGIQIDASYYCPHTPDDGCGCRKPRTELLERACSTLAADLERSWVIGDSSVDVALAIAAGCRSAWVPRAGQSHGEIPAPAPTLQARDFEQAVARILSFPER